MQAGYFYGDLRTSRHVRIGTTGAGNDMDRAQLKSPAGVGGRKVNQEV